MTLEEARDKLAKALVYAVGQHGAPNSFLCRELAWEYGGPRPTLAGRVGKHYMQALHHALPPGWIVEYLPGTRQRGGPSFIVRQVGGEHPKEEEVS